MSGEEALQFRDVEAIDASTVFLMSAGPGDLSRIYRTDDGGGNWVQQYAADHPDAFLDCLAFWDRERGLAYGDAVDGVLFLLRTEDGGITWERVPGEVLPPALEGEGGFAASGTCLVTGGEGRAWIATGNGSRARVLRTVDWGRSWEDADVPVVGGSGAGLTTIFMDESGRRGLALGGIIGQDSARTVNVAVTRDGGASWVPGGPRARPGPAYGSALAGLPRPRAPGRAGGRTASGPDLSRAAPIAVAVGPRGMDWSGDLGKTWAALDTLAWWAVAFASATDGWAVGPDGRILKLSLEEGEASPRAGG
jgi:photosystem II stability/assembly factor-like uncharacterized protein